MMRNMASTHKIGWFLFSIFFFFVCFFAHSWRTKIYKLADVQCIIISSSLLTQKQSSSNFNIVVVIFVVDMMIRLVLSYCCAGHVHRRCQYPILIEVDNDLLDFLVHQLIRVTKKKHLFKQQTSEGSQFFFRSCVESHHCRNESRNDDDDDNRITDVEQIGNLQIVARDMVESFFFHIRRLSHLHEGGQHVIIISNTKILL